MVRLPASNLEADGAKISEGFCSTASSCRWFLALHVFACGVLIVCGFDCFEHFPAVNVGVMTFYDLFSLSMKFCTEGHSLKKGL